MFRSTRCAVFRYPYFFRTTFVGPPWVPSECSRKVELYAGSLQPATVVFLRLVGLQDRVPSDCGFCGFVARSADALQGSVISLAVRSNVQLVVGRLNPPTRDSWLAPAPWNYSPFIS